MPELSVLIPARNEEFVALTVEDVLKHSEADTEIIVVLDGEWANPPIKDDPRVTIMYHPVSIGQRAACNEAAKLARAPWLIKLDAHCSMGQGFDRILLATAEPHMTIVPVMTNLDVFDRVCKACGHRRRQGPTQPCPQCGGEEERVMVWAPKKRTPHSTAYCFDSEPHFQYFGALKKRVNDQRPLSETMSLQGSCFMMTKKRWFQLNVCDERYGSWGSQGIEVAVKSWCGPDAEDGKPGRVLCNHDTEYSHAFRTQGGDWGFPYPNPQKRVEFAKQRAREDFFEGRWDKMVKPLSWLLERFWPVYGWTDEDLAAQKEREAGRGCRAIEETAAPITVPDSGHSPRNSSSDRQSHRVADSGADKSGLTKAVLYYTCLTHPELVEDACRANLDRARGDLALCTVSRGAGIDFGDTNVIVEGERGPLTMHRQILAGLQEMPRQIDYVFLCENDVLYHHTHFDFTPPTDDAFWYNTNVWKVWLSDGLAVWTDDLQQVSGCCASRELLLEFYERRVQELKSGQFNRHYEPGPKTSKHQALNWQSMLPNLDVRHGKTLTRSKRKASEFRDQKYAKGFKTADEVPGWGVTKGRMEELLRDIAEAKE